MTCANWLKFFVLFCFVRTLFAFDLSVPGRLKACVIYALLAASNRIFKTMFPYSILNFTGFTKCWHVRLLKITKQCVIKKFHKATVLTFFSKITKELLIYSWLHALYWESGWYCVTQLKCKISERERAHLGPGNWRFRGRKSSVRFPLRCVHNPAERGHFLQEERDSTGLQLEPLPTHTQTNSDQENKTI